MKNIIVKLWNNGQLPIKDAIYFSSGESFSLKIATHSSTLLQKGDFFNLYDLYHKDESEITNIDILNEIKLSNDYYCCVGEGSYGSEGFIAYLDINRELIWVMYFEESNPFFNITEYSPGNILAESSANVKLNIKLSRPIEFFLVE